MKKTIVALALSLLTVEATAGETLGNLPVNGTRSVDSAPLVVNVDWIQKGKTILFTRETVLSQGLLHRDGYEVGQVTCTGTKETHTLASSQVFIGRALAIRPITVDASGNVGAVAISAQDTHEVGMKDMGPDWCLSRTVDTAGLTVSGLMASITRKGVTVIPLDADNSLRITPVSE